MKSYLDFLRYLHEEGIELDRMQKRFCRTLISKARKDRQIRVFLTARRTGKTLAFEQLTRYFNTL